MPRTASHRLFFAVWPEAAVRAQLEALSVTLGKDYEARWVKPARWHLTLCFLGSHDRFPERLAECAVRAADSVQAQAFSWYPDRVGSFRASRPPCALLASRACEPLQHLHRSLVDALSGSGARVDTRPYVPHVTLGYGHGRRIGDKALPPLDFPVHAFVLLHSVSGQATYRQLGCWPLDPSP